MKALADQNNHFCLASQVLYEFWVVATRPLGEFGLNLPASDAYSEMQNLRGMFEVLHDSRAVLEKWGELVQRYSVRGKPAHDARIAAVMMVNGTRDILTFNVSDFARFPEITVHSPADLASRGGL